MNCQKYENELFESFGIDSLSQDLQNHITTCDSCKAIYENLLSLSSEIGNDETFFDTDESINQNIEQINKKIDRLELSKVVSVAKWKSYVPMAAAIVLVLGIGLITKILLQFDNTDTIAEISEIETLYVSLTDDETKSLNEIELSDFVDEYSSEYGLENEMQLLDDISEEEFKYLEENLNIGEIL